MRKLTTMGFSTHLCSESSLRGGVAALDTVAAQARPVRIGWRVRTVVSALVVVLALTIGAASSWGASYRIVGWGFNEYGTLGNGNFKNSTKPVQAGELLGVSAVAANEKSSAALLDSGQVLQWGYLGETAKGSGEPWFSAVPLPVEGLTNVTAIAPGVALLSDGTVMEWGGPAPTPVSGIANAIAVARDGSTSAVLLSDGTVRTWGDNEEGELGDGLTEWSSVPVEVCAVGTAGPCPHGPYLSGVTAVSVGEYFTLALLKDGTVAAWGYDAFGELGGGYGSPHIPNPDPNLIGSLTGVKSISAGSTHGDALMGDGTVKEWGWDGALPTQVSGLGGVTAISAGSSFTMALLADGTVRTWGSNKYGQLGDGKHMASTTPVVVGGLTGVTSISAGAVHALTTATPEPPLVKGISPKHGPASGGTTVTLRGSGLTGATEVDFGSTQAEITSDSAKVLTVISPAGTGTVDVTVTTPGGSSAPHVFEYR